MSVQLNETMGGRVLEVHVSGRLEHEDYERFVPELDRLIGEHGKIALVFDMVDFHGWDAHALWDDVKVDFRHFLHFIAVAMVGDRAWQKGMAAFCRPFTTAKVRYFQRDELAEARAWIEDVVNRTAVSAHA